MPGSIVGTDTGGTFTDFVLMEADRLVVYKVPSTPAELSRAVATGLEALPLSPDTVVAHGSTVATNALLERKGARTALVTTAGFEDVLQIGRQARRGLYDLQYEPPEPLVPSGLRLGVLERVDAAGNVLREVSAEEVRRLVARLKVLEVEAVAVALLFSFLYPEHEEQLRLALEQMEPQPFISLSSEVLPEFREYERSSTVTANSYVGPLVSRYLGRMEELVQRPLRVMQSSGGGITAALARRQPVRTILSGPAGGVIGATYAAGAAGFAQVITLDMGGTSTDVALCPGRVQTTTSSSVGASPVSVPMIDIQTVGAGGGSLVRIDAGGALLVGPESAGASPGPACYGVGDQATVTDANLLLGRMAPTHFLGGRMALDAERAGVAMDRVAISMGGTREEASMGVVRVANAVVERALRTVSLEQGHDPRDFTLVAFGGAGPQHACELAAALGIPRVLVPLYPGVLSALGVAVADVVKDYSRTVMVRDEAGMAQMEAAFQALESQGRAEMAEEGFPREELHLRRWLDVRYRGQSFELPVDWPEEKVVVLGNIASAFHTAHERRFGYKDERAPVEVVNVRLSAVAPTARPPLTREEAAPGEAPWTEERPIWFEEGPQATRLFDREALRPGHWFRGPGLVFQMDATTVVPPGWLAEVDPYRNLVLSPETDHDG